MKYIALFFLYFSISLSSTAQKFDLKQSISAGLDVYSVNCQSCHMEQGEGLEGVYPPLAKSDYLMADKKRSIKQVIGGVSGPIIVNGIEYNSDMSGYPLNDDEVAHVLNYIRNSFGNKGAAVTPAEVAAERKLLK
jgi:mono/diheme cytochrome c family protein